MPSHLQCATPSQITGKQMATTFSRRNACRLAILPQNSETSEVSMSAKIQLRCAILFKCDTLKSQRK